MLFSLTVCLFSGCMDNWLVGCIFFFCVFLPKKNSCKICPKWRTDRRRGKWNSLQSGRHETWSFISNDDDIPFPAYIHQGEVHWRAMLTVDSVQRPAVIWQARDKPSRENWGLHDNDSQPVLDILSKTNSSANKDRHSIMLKSDIIWPTACQSTPDLCIITKVHSSAMVTFLRMLTFILLSFTCM